MRQFLLALLFISGTVQAQNIRIQNTAPRLDVSGKPVDAHDGRVIQFGKQFYWYGTRYGSTNGFTTANEYVVYSSPDMNTWRAEGAILPEKPEGVYYRPHVVYNARSRQYVLWYNWYPKLWNGKFGVAVSDSPTGPFRIVNPDVQVKHSKMGVGDLSVFVDEDQTAYLSYNTIQGHQVCVEKLTASYTESAGETSDFLARDCEAGSMFKYNGYYHLLTDVTCCFCSQGSGARVYRSKTPLGPYQWMQNINRQPGIFLPQLTDEQLRNGQYHTAKPAEWILAEFSMPTQLSGIHITAHTANRKSQCGQVNEPLVHEPIAPAIMQMEYESENGWKPLPVLDSAVMIQAITATTSYRFARLTTQRIRMRPAHGKNIVLAEIAVKDAKAKPLMYAVENGGGGPIIPAQQTHVMTLKTAGGTVFLWMGDMWGSALDGQKGHDLQYWSKPLKFNALGHIDRLVWADAFELKR